MHNSTSTDRFNAIKYLKTRTLAFTVTGLAIAALIQLNVAPSYAAVTNLIANPSVETPTAANANLPASWTTDTWANGTAKFAYLTTGLNGNRSVKVTLSGANSGDAKWVPNPVAAKPNTDYTYTDMYRANVATHVVYEAIDAKGNATYDDVAITVSASATVTKTFTGKIHTPADTVKLTVLHLLETNGWLQIDNVSLVENAVTTTPTPTPTQTPTPTPKPTVTPTPTPTPTPTIVPNPSVETPDPNNPQQPQNWSSTAWGTNTHTFSYVTGAAAAGSRSVQACITKYGTNPDVSGDANWQFASQPLTKGADYRATFSYKTNNLHAVHVVAHYVKADGSEDFFGMPDPEPAGDNAANWTTYSDVFNVPTDVVSADVFMVMRGIGCVSVDNMQLAPYTYTGFDKGRVILTFDDAPDINYLNALPVLDLYGFKTTMYLPTKEGTYAPGWVEGNAAMETIVKKFASGGHEIGAHSITHPDMTTLACPGPELTNELKHPQDYLRQLTGQPITAFSSPFGAYNACTNSVTAQYYGSHRTTDEGYNSKDNFNAYRLREQNMAPTTTLAQFKYWVDKAARDHTTLILTYHNIDDPNNPDQAADAYDTYLPDFKAQMAYLASKSGVSVQRLDAALVEMRSQL